MTSPSDRRLLLVHAHPDDETIQTGATMAKYAAEGAQVTLVTCTLGEEGEVLVPDLAHLAADADDGLGEHRIGELDKAMEILGVTDHVFLGGPGRFRDSGMAWHAEGHAVAREETRTDSFWSTDLLVAADELVRIIRDRRPQVLLVYDQIGNYGHPDHIQAHRVGTYAAALAGVPSYQAALGEPWSVQRVLWTAMSGTAMRERIREIRASGDTESWKGFDPDGPLPPMASPDEAIAVRIDGSDFIAEKLDAMRAHATQITAEGPFFSGGLEVARKNWGSEYYRFASGVPFDTDGWADDLFAGLT